MTDQTDQRRVSLYLTTELVEVIDAFAAMNKRSRSFVVTELLEPSIPALRELLKLSDSLKGMSDVERAQALSRLNLVERSLSNNADKIPGALNRISEGV